MFQSDPEFFEVPLDEAQTGDLITLKKGSFAGISVEGSVWMVGPGKQVFDVPKSSVAKVERKREPLKPGDRVQTSMSKSEGVVIAVSGKHAWIQFHSDYEPTTWRIESLTKI